MNRLTFLILLMLVLLALGGTYFYRSQSWQAKAKAENELTAIGQLKARQIITWRRERIADATSLANNRFLTGYLAGWLTGPQDSAIEPDFDRLAQSLRDFHGYRSVILLDAAGHQRYGQGDQQGEPNPEERASFDSIWRTGRPELSDLHKGGFSPVPHLDLLVPLFDGGHPAGAIVLVIDAGEFLYPALRDWPVPSASAESLLVRREGDQVLYLSESRHLPGLALTRRLPLTQTGTLAVAAVLGNTGIIEGVDYRGADTVATLQAILGSSWSLIAKIDKAELFADLRSNTVLLTLAWLCALALLGALLLAAVQRQKREHFRTLFEAERTRNLSEERYARVVEDTNDGIWDWHLQTHAVYISPRWKAILGYAEHELPNEESSFFDRLHPDDRDRVLDAQHRHLEEDIPYQVEFRLRHKDGSYHWVRSRGQAVRDGAGRAVRLHGAMTDITERKQAEADLKASAAALQRAQQVAKLGSWYFHAERKRLVWTDQLYRIFGVAADTPLSLDLFLSKVHPEDRVALESAWQAALKGAPYDIEHRIVVEGQDRWVHERAELQINATGELVGGIGTVQDITEQRRALEALRESEERFRIFTQHSGDAFILLNGEDGRIILWNQAAEAMFGYLADEALGMPLHQVIAPKRYREAAAAGLARFVRTGEGTAVGKTLELAALRKTGEEFPIELSLAAIRSHGHWLAAGVVRNITERKRHEAETEAARQAAEAANRAKSEFLANMSHEIRTPLNAILGLTQILERDTLTPDHQDFLRKINEAGTALLHIINDILDLSKIEAGQLRMERQPFVLSRVMCRLESLLKHAADAKGIAFSVSPPGEPGGEYWGDALRLEQILINLAGNAIKFTETGQIEITVLPLVVTDTEVQLRFEVRDTGIGIPPEQLLRLFLPFSQGDSGTTRRFGGTGLGLSISKRLVEMMGGQIGVTSLLGKGSMFWFEVPFERVTGEQSESTLPETHPDTGTGPRLRGLRVLAVDDNHINLFMLERALKLEGANTELAGDGRLALEILQANPTGFDVVLMDVQMPIMDGLTATRALRADSRLARLPVIACSAGVLDDEREAALSAGIDGFLAKPVDLEQMVAVLSPYLPETLGPPG